MKATLVFVKDTERVSAKTGKPYTSRSIKTQEHGEAWLSGFANKDNANWKVGDSVEIEVEEVVKDGKKYLNFSVPKAADKMDDKLETILNKLTGIIITLETIKANTATKKPNSYPQESNETAFDEMPPNEEPPF